MIANKRNTFWKPTSQSEKLEIIEGFKDLHQHKQNKEKSSYNTIIELMIKDIKFIVGNPQLFGELPTPYIPKSNSRDIKD